VGVTQRARARNATRIAIFRIGVDAVESPHYLLKADY
jgi:hypothetical protein